MWRALFLAVGVFMMLLGAEALAVETVDFRPFLHKANETYKTIPYDVEPWLPWSLICGGAMVCIYSFTLPTRFKNS